MSTYTIKYGNSATGYATAELVRGPRGGISVIRHDGDRRRVSEVASLITTGGDSLACQVIKP